MRDADGMEPIGGFNFSGLFREPVNVTVPLIF